MAVSTFTYTRTHTAAFVADHMRNQLKRIVHPRHHRRAQLLEAGMTKVSDAFATFKSRLELTQTEKDDASRRQKDVRATVQEAFHVDHDFLTGSYGRHTKTKPLKDIDIFVCLGSKEDHRRKAHPKAVLDDLETCLVDAYGRDQVERDRRCVTVWFEKRHQTQHEEGKVVSRTGSGAAPCRDREKPSLDGPRPRADAHGDQGRWTPSRGPDDDRPRRVAAAS